jgi:hypothetical protein
MAVEVQESNLQSALKTRDALIKQRLSQWETARKLTTEATAMLVAK